MYKRQATSIPEKGSQFFFEIPFKIDKNSKESFAENTPNLLEKSVLIIDDNEREREILSSVLSSFGAKITKAESADRALEVLKLNSNFNLILVDCRMPNKGGFDFVEEIIGYQLFDRIIAILPPGHRRGAVSYTHLTLPTKRIV